MSLGVLNNLNAISAENNLNNTSNSLSKVLGQLSSGSKITSGADDAAGLSLVNGLQANSMALSQSTTNASEGVGLLTVADGALSQVNSLLNRAVTLATEASNGTLNSSQDTAANQEYQSILSEVSNIGSTTTYNGTAVFGSTTAIYTGDSSTAGASVNSLNIRSLSSSNLGDTNGVMAYSNGASNVFVDLSTTGKNASLTDTLGASTATTTVAVSYIAKGANGSAVNASANINVGAGTNYANTAQGLISAINGAGLGLSASFGTAAQAGGAATSTATSATDTNSALLTGSSDTGIIISGAGVGVDNSSLATGFSSGAGVVGKVAVSQASDTLGGTLSVTDSGGESHSITLGTTNSTDTLANLASTINAAGYGVTASVNTSTTTNASGAHAAGTLLTFTSASSQATVGTTSATDAGNISAQTLGSIANNAVAVISGGTLSTMTANSATDTLSGVLTVGYGAAATATTLTTLNLNGQTLTQIAANFNSGAMHTTTAGAIAAAVTTAASGVQTLTFTQTYLSGAAADNSKVIVEANSAVQSSALTTGNAIVAQTTSGGTGATYGTVTLDNANSTLTSGSLNIGGTSLTLGTAGSTDSLANLAATINANAALTTAGISAAVNSAGTVLSLTGGTAAANDTVVGTGVTSSLSLTGTPTSASTPSLTTMGTLTLAAGSTSASAIAGTLAFGTETITLGTAATTSTPGTATMTELAATINGGNYGVSATLNQAGTAIALTTSNSNSGAQATAGTDNITPVFTNNSGTVMTFGTQNAGATSSAYYSVGISGTVQDTSTGANTTAALTKGNSNDLNGSGGVATTSYSDAAGVSLSSTDLSTQADAQAALSLLNKAVTAVSAQDGYIGAQINQLNAVSSVLSTQSENVTSAQNAVQATDYASATSNMSKYEILSQTGISALAQANSVQQEVTKLLQ